MAADDSTTETGSAATATGSAPARHSRTGRTVLVVAIVVLVVLACELATRGISGRLYPPEWAAGEVAFKTRQLEQVHETGRVDTVFLGDSMIDAGVNPLTFATAAPSTGTGYNAALLGAPLPAQQLWSDRIVLDRLAPTLAVLGVSPTSVSTLGVGSRDRLTYGEVITDNVRSLDDDAWARLADQVGEHVELVRYRTSLRNPRLVASATWQTLTGEGSLDSSVRPPSFWAQNVADHGQVLSYGGGLAAPTGPEGLITNIKTMLDADMVMAPLDDAVGALRQRGVSVVLVVPPTALDVMAASGVDVDRWQAAARRIGERAAELDVPFLDYTAAGFDRSRFFDPFHLNRSGSERFSTELGRAVETLCRTDPRLRCAR